MGVMKIMMYLRQALPYISKHRNKSVLVVFPESAVASLLSQSFLHDMALLRNLGLHLLLMPVKDAHKIINASLSEERFECFVRQVNSAWEAFSQANAHVRVPLIWCPLFIAQPKGVVSGVSADSLGKVRQVESERLHTLKQDNILWVPPIAYAPNGKGYALEIADIVQNLAVYAALDKVVVLGDMEELPKGLRSSVHPNQLDIAYPLFNLAKQLVNYVPRVHLVSCQQEGGVLTELYTRDGSGVLVHKDTYDVLRQAQLEDVGALCGLVLPYQKKGILVERGEPHFEQHIEEYHVMERDGNLIGCYAVFDLGDQGNELACLVVAEDARGLRLGDVLLGYAIEQSKQQGKQHLFALSTQSMDWFAERGFESVDVRDLPKQRIEAYSKARNSKVLCLALK